MNIRQVFHETIDATGCTTANAHHIGDRHAVFGSHERHIERCLQRRLVPTRQCAPRVRRLELRRGDVTHRSIRMRVLRAVEASELFAQRAGVLNSQFMKTSLINGKKYEPN